MESNHYLIEMFPSSMGCIYYVGSDWTFASVYDSSRIWKFPFGGDLSFFAYDRAV